MSKLSLRLRSFAAVLLALIVFLPLTVLTLEQAFTASLTESMLERLRLQSLTLISEFEMEDDLAVMPEQLFNDQLNIPGSGLYAYIQQDKSLIWGSLSSLNMAPPPLLSMPGIGQESFVSDFMLHGKKYFLFSYTAEFQGSQDFIPISFYILHDRVSFDNERRAFGKKVWYWFVFIAVALMILLILSFNTVLHPIQRLIGQINRAEKGEIDRITQSYPPELEKLKTSINHLLDTEQQQRVRYKNSLSDLAHSLKTPLAVLSGNQELPEEAREPISQIDSIIQRQLKRAVAGAGSGWEQAVEVSPLVSKLLSAMQKVYVDKGLSISSDISADCYFKGDDTDLMEILGNLVDNACKAAQTEVNIKAFIQNKQLFIEISDDGPGIAEESREAMLTRGTRLDSYTEGQGIGMAVVTDLVSAYQGHLKIGNAPSGGACIEISFGL